ncbi:endonuclease/exonuclease/phosphatase family protein [uncultured Ferrimonas sp.]|uniref:endonuclease/exonuclease/phosphatase family protein n=1 Tax=uncultured Ferrimonas sp. TaxID=432640 RepID=UPI0026338F85|nr:endonuclease/exonuclease/phosphatase family protein [uncultured Ferrimonas sp.]
MTRQAKLALLLTTLALPLLLLSATALLPNAATPQTWLLRSAAQAPLPSQFTLLNWNIQKRSQQPQWQQQFDQIQRQYQPELLTLQEVVLDAKRRNPTNHNAVFAANLMLSEGYSGLLNAAPSLPTHSQVRFSKDTEPLANTPKLALYSHYSIGDQQLLLVNIHAINFVSNSAYQRQLSDLLSTVQAHSGLLLLSGDFNSWSPQRLTLLQQQMSQLGLHPVQFTNPDKIKAFLGSPLDHVFASPALKVTTAVVLDQYQSSDHAPMLVQFQVQQNDG